MISRVDQAATVTTAANGPDPNEALAWERAKRRLRIEFGDDVYSSWFARLDLDGIVDDTAQLSVPTRFLKSWLESHYLDKILTLLMLDLPQVTRIALVVRSASTPRQMPARAPARAEPEATRAAEAAPANRAQAPAHPSLRLVDQPREDDLGGSPLDRRMTFDTFFTGRSNALAHAAAMKVAKLEPGEPSPFNPLYVHASVGLGKTHLIQAIAHKAESAGRRVLYLTAEKFMYGFVAALKAQTAIAFKEKLRTIDMLVIDDLQFLAGKTIQQEFCHTLNALIDGGKQVVVAADRPPTELETLEERVRSRLSGGLAVEIGALDEELRVRILEARIAAARHHTPHFEASSAVVTYVARQINTNGRDLEGAVNRLLAHAAIAPTGLTVEIAESAIRDLVKNREPKRVKIEDIQRIVAKHYNVTRADILSLRRTATVVKPRQVAMFLSKSLTPRSLPEIGRRFGGRDHTTVLHAVRKIEGLVSQDHALAEEVELLKRMLIE